jgi:hypothetical protein
MWISRGRWDFTVQKPLGRLVDDGDAIRTMIIGLHL